MSQYDLLIRNGTLVGLDGVKTADLAIDGEHVVAIEPELAGTARAEIDACGLHIFPGVIDAHVHFNEPGRTEWEGFATGTRALAAGGTTTFFDMPLNASPPTLDAHSFALKKQAAQASSLVDFALWGGLVPNNLTHLEELAACGVVGFKAFMSNSGIEDFPSVDDQTLYDGMLQAAKLHKLVAVHAEDDRLTSELARQAITQGRTGIRAYLASRPVIAELDAINRAIRMAEETNCALHIVHVSSGSGVAQIAEARARGIDVSCETCPHYLVLTEDDAEQLGAVAKCAPPLRAPDEQASLWQQLLTGNIQFIGSDHSPAPASMKTSANFFQVWGGISGCQSLLQLLLTKQQQSPTSRDHQKSAQHHVGVVPCADPASHTTLSPARVMPHTDPFKQALTEGHEQELLDTRDHRDNLSQSPAPPQQIPLPMLVSLTSNAVARRFHIPQKGNLAIGSDADLVLVDLQAQVTLQASDLYYRHVHSPYIGRTLQGRIVQTLVRGTTVYKDGQFGKTPQGRLLTPINSNHALP